MATRKFFSKAVTSEAVHDKNDHKNTGLGGKYADTTAWIGGCAGHWLYAKFQKPHGNS